MGRGFGISAQVDHGVVQELARAAENLGYTSFWANDVPVAEGLVALAAAATTTDRIRLGVGVIPLDQRPAEEIARRVESLQLPQDRLLVGVGAGESKDALDRVRAGVGSLHDTVHSTIVVGALGPRMAALAGEIADGVLFNWQVPEHAARAGRWVLDAADRAGRPRPLLTAYVRCGLTPQVEDSLRQEIARYAGIPAFERHLERMDAGAYDTYVVGPDRAALQPQLATYDAVLDETIVRAVTADDSLDSMLALMHACAP